MPKNLLIYFQLAKENKILILLASIAILILFLVVVIRISRNRKNEIKNLIILLDILGQKDFYNSPGIQTMLSSIGKAKNQEERGGLIKIIKERMEGSQGKKE